MRIAFLSFDFGEYSIRLANALAQKADILLMLPSRDAEPYLVLLDKAVDFRPFSLPRLRQPLHQLKMLAGFQKLFRDFSPDVLHLQQGHLWFNLGLGFFPRSAFVLTIHDCRPHPGDIPSTKTPQRVLNLAYRRAEEIIVHSNYVKQQLVLLYRISAQRIHVIPHIGLGHAGNEAHNQRAPTVLFFGRIWEYKGLEYLIRAEPFITEEVPDVKIIIAGQGEAFTRYRKMMVHPERFVVHNEYIPGTVCDELFEEAAVVTVPYIEASQSGVVPLAFTHGKPVVGTRVGGIPEMVEDGQTGFCVPPRDERALANAIVRILKDPDLAHSLGMNAKRKIDTECSPTQIANQTFEVYRRAAHALSKDRVSALSSQTAGSNEWEH